MKSGSTVELFLVPYFVVVLAAYAKGVETILVPADADTIQEAIQIAEDGDLVLVSSGIYLENLDFLGKAITVESVAGPEETFVDAGGRRARLSGAEPRQSGVVLCASAVASALQAVAHGQRIRSLLPDRALFSR